VATDAITLEMIAVYAHMERIAALEDSFGLKGVLPRPRLVSIQSRVTGSDGHLQNDNAAYYGDADVIAVMPTTDDGAVPIAMNGGVLAHENFHALFHRFVLKNLGEDEAAHGARNVYDEFFGRGRLGTATGPFASSPNDFKMQNRLVLSALNEGLADWWAWVYSGDGEFLRRSVRSMKTRAVVSNRWSLPGHDFFFRDPKVDPDLFVRVRSYQLGTYYAGILRALAEKQGVSKTVQALFRSLKQLPTQWKALSGKSAVSPNILLAMLASSEPGEAVCCLARTRLSGEFDDFNLASSCQGFASSCAQ
jgi:hypothetical protein